MFNGWSLGILKVVSVTAHSPEIILIFIIFLKITQHIFKTQWQRMKTQRWKL